MMQLRGRSPVTEFDRTTALIPLTDRAGHFVVELDAGWSALVGMHGGYLCALAVRAAESLAPERVVRTVSTSFLRTGQAGPALLSMRELRRGRSMTTMVAELVQNDQILIATRLTLMTPRSGLEWNEPRPPDLPPPRDCVPFTAPPDVAHFEQFELRFDPRQMPFDGDDASIAGYVRPHDARPVDAAWLVMAADCFPPPAFARTEPPNGGISVDLTVHVHRSGFALTDGAWLDRPLRDPQQHRWPRGRAGPHHPHGRNRGGRVLPHPPHGAELNAMYAHSRRTLTIASLATLATFLDTTILFVAFPAITTTFSNTSASELSWVLNAYTIVFAALLIPAGKLADRVGHRTVFLTGSGIFTLASMACGLAPTAELLILFRIVQALGAAALIPSSLGLVIHAFAHDQLPRAVAIWGASGALAGALGPTLGAAIVEGLGWRWAFFINLPVGMYTMMAGRRHLQESSDPKTQVPSPGGVILIAAAAGLLSYAVVGSDEFGWLSARTVGVFAAGLVALAVFVRHQQHTQTPVLDLELFRIANFRWATLATLAFGTAFTALFLGSILFLTQVWGWSILQAGFGVAPGPVTVGLLAPRVGKLAGRIGQRPILITGGILFASSGLYRLAMLGPDVNYLRDYFPSMMLSGLGVACVFPQLSSVVAQALPPGRAGVGGAAVQALRQFGGTFGVALTVAILGAAAAPTDAFDRIWWIVLAGGLATSALVLPMRTTKANQRPVAVRPLDASQT